MIVAEYDQRTEEWLQVRKGKFTASAIHKLMGARGLGKTGESYIWEKVAEELNASIYEPVSFAMSRGIELEQEAKEYYERKHNVCIKDQPFIIAEWCDQAGCSPDGFITGNTGFEVKCPINPVIHLRRFMYNGAGQDSLKTEEPEIYWQIMMSMAVTEFRSWIFASYFPDIDENYKMYVLKVEWNEADINLLKSRILDAVNMKIETLNKLG